MAIDTCDLNLVKVFINCDLEKNPEMIRSKMNATTRSGDTALHFAAGANFPRKKKCNLLRLLVNSGADSSIENNEKEKAESITTKDLVNVVLFNMLITLEIIYWVGVWWCFH